MNNGNLQELLDLAGAVCEDCATAEQQQRLDGILANDSDAQEAYANYMMLHAELFWQQESLRLDPAQSVSPAKEQSARRRNWNTWIFSLAAMLVLGSLIGLSSSRFFRGNELANGESVELERTAAVELGEWVATVSGTRNSRWTTVATDRNTEQRIPVGYGSKIYAGQPLNLVEGIAEITFNTGVRIIIEAPARLDLSSIDESTLYAGRMTASVPKGAEGFKIACRGITLVDRGTEFGVQSDGEGETEVHVFDGLVEGHVKNPNGSTFKKVSWKTNDAVRYSSMTNEIKTIDKSSSFVRSLSNAAETQQGVFAAEDFDYPVGPLGGQNGGYGWGGPWEDISVANNSPEGNGVTAGSIPISGINHLGNHALLNGQFNRIRRNLSTSFSGVFATAGLIENQDGARLIGQDGTSIYLSFSQKISKTDDVFYGFELNRADGNRNRVLCIGHAAARGWFPGPPRTPNKDAGVTGWSVTSEFNGQNGELLELGELGPETTEPVFIVVKLTFGSGNRDEVKVFLNPSSMTREEDCVPAVVGYGNFAFDRIGLANFEGDKSYEVDHIRMGTEFSSVTTPNRGTEFASKNPDQ